MVNAIFVRVHAVKFSQSALESGSDGLRYARGRGRFQVKERRKEHRSKSWKS